MTHEHTIPPLFRKSEPSLTTMDVLFDAKHPGVFSEFRRIARELKAQGFKHYSARAIVTVIRHHTAVSMGPECELKINDHVSPYLGRRLVRECPDYAGWFEFRAVKGEAEEAA